MKEYLDNKVFELISEVADKKGVECYVIGGFVRDIFLKRPSNDIDVVVVGSGNSAKNEMSYLKNIASKVYHIHHDDPIPKDAVAVFVAIGRVPNTDFLKGKVDLNKDGYVVAGEDCETSVPGIFVAGDCRTKAVRQLITAASDGAIAAEAAVKYLK